MNNGLGVTRPFFSSSFHQYGRECVLMNKNCSRFFVTIFKTIVNVFVLWPRLPYSIHKHMNLNFMEIEIILFVYAASSIIFISHVLISSYR